MLTKSPPWILNLPTRVNTKLTLTYANKTITSEPTIAFGMLFCGLCASSPVVAIISKPIKA